MKMSNSKNYYTEAVKVVDLPVYLDEQHINYKLVFMDQIGILRGSWTHQKRSRQLVLMISTLK